MVGVTCEQLVTALAGQEHLETVARRSLRDVASEIMRRVGEEVASTGRLSEACSPATYVTGVPNSSLSARTVATSSEAARCQSRRPIRSCRRVQHARPQPTR